MTTSEAARPPAKLSHFGNAFEKIYGLSPRLTSLMVGRRVESLFDLKESSSGNLERFIQIGRQGGRLLAFAGNHQSYLDPIAYLPVFRKIRSDLKLEGVRMVIAKSLEDGQQGETSEYFKVADPYLKQNHVETVAVVRNADGEKYGMKKNISEIRDSLDKMVASYTDKKLLVILPPGETWEGKREEGGDGSLRNGMKKFTKEHVGLAKVLSDTLLSDVGFAILPGAINESYNVFDPDTKQLTKAVETHLKRKFPPGFLAYPGCPKFATATVGCPVTETEYNAYLINKGLVDRPLNLKELGMFMKRNPLTLIEFVMVENIGRMLPPEAQGVYRDYIRDVKPGAWTQI